MLQRKACSSGVSFAQGLDRDGIIESHGIADIFSHESGLCRNPAHVRFMEAVRSGSSLGFIVRPHIASCVAVVYFFQ